MKKILIVLALLPLTMSAFMQESAKIYIPRKKSTDSTEMRWETSQKAASDSTKADLKKRQEKLPEGVVAVDGYLVEKRGIKSVTYK